MSGDHRWPRRRVLASLAWIIGQLGPFLLAAIVAYAVSRIVTRPIGPAVLLWWLGLAAVGVVVVVATSGLARRARTLAVLLGTSATFPSRPPSRLVIAWSAPDAVSLRRVLGALPAGGTSGNAETTRAAFAAALWTVQARHRHAQLAWHSGSRDITAHLTDGDIPGLLQVLRVSPARGRTLAAGAFASAVMLLIASVALADVQPEGSTQLATRPKADGPGSSLPVASTDAGPQVAEAAGGASSRVERPPSSTGSVAPSTTGSVAPSGNGSVAPSSSGFVVPSSTGFVAPAGPVEPVAPAVGVPLQGEASSPSSAEPAAAASAADDRLGPVVADAAVVAASSDGASSDGAVTEPPPQPVEAGDPGSPIEGLAPVPAAVRAMTGLRALTDGSTTAPAPPEPSPSVESRLVPGGTTPNPVGTGESSQADLLNVSAHDLPVNPGTLVPTPVLEGTAPVASPG